MNSCVLRDFLNVQTDAEFMMERGRAFHTSLVMIQFKLTTYLAKFLCNKSIWWAGNKLWIDAETLELIFIIREETDVDNITS